MTFIRSTHWAAYRSGQWVEILTIAPAADGKDCYIIRFPDGETDWWAVHDPDAGYEFTDNAHTNE